MSFEVDDPDGGVRPRLRADLRRDSDIPEATEVLPLTLGAFLEFSAHDDAALFDSVVTLGGGVHDEEIRRMFGTAWPEVAQIVRRIANRVELGPPALIERLTEALDDEFRAAGYNEAALAPARAQLLDMAGSIRSNPTFEAVDALFDAHVESMSRQIGRYLPRGWDITVADDLGVLALEHAVPLIDVVREETVLAFVAALHRGEPLSVFDTHRDEIIEDIAVVAERAERRRANGNEVLSEVLECLRRGNDHVALIAAVTTADVLAHILDDPNGRRTRYQELVDSWQQHGSLNDIPIPELKLTLVMHGITRTYARFHAHIEPAPDAVNRHVVHAVDAGPHAARNALWAALLLAQIIELTVWEAA